MTNGALKSALIYVTFAKVLTEVQCHTTNWLIQSLKLSSLMSESDNGRSCECPTMRNNVSHSYLP